MGQGILNGKFDLGTALKAGGIGALTAAAAFSVGHMPGLEQVWNTGPKVFDSIYVTEATVKPLLHGAAQGGVSALDGGDFVQGFLSGMLSSVGGQAIQGLDAVDNFLLAALGKSVVGAVSGAGGTLLVGGNPAMGAMQGAFIQLFNELLEVPKAPPGVDIDKNMEEAAQNKWDLLWFYNQVKNKAPWDYKRLSTYPMQYEPFGNFHYGAVGTAAGYPEWLLLRAAGGAQVITSRTKWEWMWPSLFGPQIFGIPIGVSPYGDDPKDQFWIQQGIEYGKNKK